VLKNLTISIKNVSQVSNSNTPLHESDIYVIRISFACVSVSNQL
jgi:hypothetical protein